MRIRVVLRRCGARLHRDASDGLHPSVEPNDVGGSPESLYGPRLVSHLDVDAEIICRIIPQARGARLHRVGRLNHRRQWLISDLEQFGSYRFWARTPRLRTDTAGVRTSSCRIRPARRGRAGLFIGRSSVMTRR